MGDFSGIDPAAMASMISSLDGSAKQAGDTASSLRRDFSWFGLDQSPLGEITTIASWAHDQLPMLRRRQGLAEALGREDPKLAMVPVPEPVPFGDDPAAAQQQGKDLADQMNGITTLDEEGARRMHQIAEQLALHKDDPDFVTAFYANLKPPTAQVLPNLLAESGSSTARADLEVFSHAFGVAVSARYPAPGMDKVKQSFTTPLPRGDYGAAWTRAAMLQFGDFPADWLASVARAGVLDQFARDPQQDFRGAGANDARALGLPDDALALTLDALGRNGEAARQALSHMGEPDHGHDARENIKTILEYTKGIGTGDEIQDALGHALVAASGARGTVDANGNFHVTLDPHTREEQEFAFDTITVVAHQEDLTNLFKLSMGRIAAAYAPELLTGGRVDDARDRGSSMAAPPNFQALAGVDPGFYLSPEDTYRFLRQLAGQDDMIAPFDEAMGQLQQRVLTAAARADLADPTSDHFGRTAEALGDLAHMEYRAEKAVRGEMDEEERQFREHLTSFLTLGIELAGEPEGILVTEGAKLSWRAAMFALKEGGFKDYVGSTPDHVAPVEDANQHMIAMSSYQVTAALLDAGWPTSTPLPAEFTSGGKLKSYKQLVDDGQLAEFEKWVDANGRALPAGSGSVHSFNDESDEAASRMTNTLTEEVIDPIDPVHG
jgi:hypothetical protein